MWKRAYCRWEPDLAVVSRDAGKRRLALTLLEDLQHSYTGSEDDLLDQLYTQLTVAHGIYKTTRRNRFREFDRIALDDFARRFESVETLRIHDLAASSGISSLELFQTLHVWRAVELHFSDLYDRLRLVRVPDSNWEVVFDSAGHALEYVGHGFALKARQGESKWHPVNRLLKRMLDRSLLPKADRLLEAAGAEKIDDSQDAVREVMLLHPECTRAFETHDNFAFSQHDLFTPLQGPYHVLRAMNIFNPGYFTDEKIIAGVRACAQGLLPGGLFLIGRSIDEEDSRTRATAFLRDGNVLRVAWKFNDGAENQSLIDGLTLDVTRTA